jgi:hypothetical protein
VFDSLNIRTVITAGNDDDDVDSSGGARLEAHVLSFAGSPLPPPATAARFFRILDEAVAAGGAVALQSGGAGRGPTGTLAALCLMRSYGFAAREAIAWVRIMRPVRAAGVCGLSTVIFVRRAL